MGDASNGAPVTRREGVANTGLDVAEFLATVPEGPELSPTQVAAIIDELTGMSEVVGKSVDASLGYALASKLGGPITHRDVAEALYHFDRNVVAIGKGASGTPGTEKNPPSPALSAAP